jgi:hypothetical protein
MQDELGGHGAHTREAINVYKMLAKNHTERDH